MDCLPPSAEVFSFLSNTGLSIENVLSSIQSFKNNAETLDEEQRGQITSQFISSASFDSLIKCMIAYQETDNFKLKEKFNRALINRILMNNLGISAEEAVAILQEVQFINKNLEFLSKLAKAKFRVEEEKQEDITMDKLTEIEKEPKGNKFLWNVTLKLCSGEIQAVAVVYESIKPISEVEELLYRVWEYPKYYGTAYYTENGISYILKFFDKPLCTLKDNITNFLNLNKNQRNHLERENFAFEAYKQLLTELVNYKNLNVVHKHICPKNVFIYEDRNNQGKYIFKLVGGEYEKSLEEGETIRFPNIKLTQLEERYCAPEIIRQNDYCKKFCINQQLFSYYISDSWSLAATVLNIIDDKNIDKWNTLNFAKSLIRIIGANIKNNPKFLLALSRSLEIEFNLRCPFTVALQELA